MKKIKALDIIFIVISIAILLCSYFFFYQRYNKTNEDSIIEIAFKNEVIDKLSADDAFNSNYIYEIKYIADKNTIYVYKNDALIKEISYHGPKDFNNTIQFKDGSIKMIEASCNGKDCMEMEINKNKSMPIVCTNGIVVRIILENNKIDILS